MNNCMKTKKRLLTRRGVLWLGQTCNLRCHFCYFMDRIKTQNHPEHPFMSIDKAKKICKTLRDDYHNNAIDIQGGEPTIYPQIYDLVKYCREIGLLPTLITNALALANIDVCKRLKDFGARDFLVSVHGLGSTYDAIVGVPGAHRKQMQGLNNLKSLDFPIRFNCVLSKMALSQLSDISRIAVKLGVSVVNFIAFNPFEDQQQSGKRSNENVPSYSQVKENLSEAIDILESSNIECNVRYFPLCMVEERHRKNVYDFQQLSYDIHEWDFASWSWTGMTSQRMRDGDVSRIISLDEATIKPIAYPGILNTVAGSLKKLLLPYPTALNAIVKLNREVSILFQINKFNQNRDENDQYWLYRENAKLRARDHCRYIYSEKCQECDAYNICDGFHGDYATIFGTDEATPIRANFKITDPKYYIANQEKVVEIEDYEWAL